MSELAKIGNTVTPAQMLQVAVEQNADLDKLEKLMELQERWEANNARKAYVAAMSSFRRDCPPIQKTRKGHNSQYAGLSETVDQIKDLMATCGLSHSWKTSQQDGLISVTCTVTHIDGHSESTSLSATADNSGAKNSIQALGSTVTYLSRYTLFAILGLASQDMDTDGAGSELPAEVIDAITTAETQEILHAVFVDAWKKYPAEKKTLTVLKDNRKRELAK